MPRAVVRTRNLRGEVAMTELAGQTVAAVMIGLLGGGHCLAMCGGIMGALSMRAATPTPARTPMGTPVPVTVTGPDEQRAVRHENGAAIGQLLLYSSGRLLSYALLGLTLGLIGAVAVAALEPMGMILRGLAGGLLIAMGLYLAGLWHGIVALERLGHGVWQRLGGGLRSQRGSALLLGMSWGLLPCGLVYGTLAWSASVADPVRSAWLMFAFGIGTLPAVLGGGWFGSRLIGALRRPGLRLTAGMLVIVFGVWTLAGGVFHGRDHDHHGSSATHTGSTMTAGSMIASGENAACS